MCSPHHPHKPSVMKDNDNSRYDTHPHPIPLTGYAQALAVNRIPFFRMAQGKKRRVPPRRFKIMTCACELKKVYICGSILSLVYIIFSCDLGMVMYDDEFETKKKKTRIKHKVEPQQINYLFQFACLITCVNFRAFLRSPDTVLLLFTCKSWLC